MWCFLPRPQKPVGGDLPMWETRPHVAEALGGIMPMRRADGYLSPSPTFFSSAKKTPVHNTKGLRKSLASCCPVLWAGRAGGRKGGCVPPGCCAQPCHKEEDQGVRKTMSYKAPKGICFHTLKPKDANSPLEPEGCLLLGKSPREMWQGGRVRKAPPHTPASSAHSAHKAQSPVQIPWPPGPRWGKSSHGKVASKPNQTL